MEEKQQTPPEQGLLDLAVELSTNDVTAGNEFAIFVLVKNPFSKPVWIREVNVSLPSELKRVDEELIQTKIKETKDQQQKKLQEDKETRMGLSGKIDSLEKDIRELTNALKSDNEESSKDLPRLGKGLETELKRLRNELRTINLGMSTVQIYDGAEVDTLRIGSQASDVQIYSGHNIFDKNSGQRLTKVKQIEIFEPWLVYEQQAQARIVKLKSSLPEGYALQAGSTAVYTVTLNVKRSLIFAPSKYRLQFYVNYSFEPMQPQVNEKHNSEDKFSTNTIAHSLSIRPSVYSVIIGSMIGGIVGSVARMLQLSPPPGYKAYTVSLVLSLILSGMAVIFMARKSDTQSFVSVEDFWGGVLIGFLVGYTGTSFFEKIAGTVTSRQ